MEGLHFGDLTTLNLKKKKFLRGKFLILEAVSRAEKRKQVSKMRKRNSLWLSAQWPKTELHDGEHLEERVYTAANNDPNNFAFWMLPYVSAVMSDLTLRVSQDSAYLQTLGGLGSPSGPLPVLLFPLCCRVCGLTLEESDLEGDKAEGEVEGDGGQVCLPKQSWFSLKDPL